MECLIVECLDLITEILFLQIFFPQDLTKKKRPYAICISVSITVLAFLCFFQDLGDVGLADALLSLLIVALVLKQKYLNKTLSFLLVYILPSLIYQIITIITDIIIRLPFLTEMGNIHQEIFIKTATIILLIPVEIIKKRKGYHFNLTNINKIVLIVSSGTVSIIIDSLKLDSALIEKTGLALIIYICIIATGIIAFYLAASSGRNALLERNLIQTKYINTLKDYYKTAEINDREIRKLRHDIKNHLSILSRLIESQKYNEADAYLSQINKTSSAMLCQAKKLPSVGNSIINALLEQKICEYPSVNIEYEGAAGENMKIEEFDLCTIVGNLLDNALEYSAKHKLDKVSFRIYHEKESLLLYITNDTAEAIDVKRLGSFSSKSGKNHGLGITSARDAVRKYNGTMTYCQEETQLTAKVQILL